MFVLCHQTFLRVGILAVMHSAMEADVLPVEQILRCFGSDRYSCCCWNCGQNSVLSSYFHIQDCVGIGLCVFRFVVLHLPLTVTLIRLFSFAGMLITPHKRAVLCYLSTNPLPVVWNCVMTIIIIIYHPVSVQVRSFS